MFIEYVGMKQRGSEYSKQPRLKHYEVIFEVDPHLGRAISEVKDPEVAQKILFVNAREKVKDDRFKEVSEKEYADYLAEREKKARLATEG